MVKNYEKAYKDRQKGLSYKEIAAKYNVSINTVKSWKIRQWAAIEKVKEKCAHKNTQGCTPEHVSTAIQAEKVKARTAHTEKAKADSKNIKAVQELVEYKKAHRPPAFSVKDIPEMIQRIGSYFNNQDDQERPYTRAGLILALGVNKDTYYRYLHGELDYLLEEHIAINSIDVSNCEVVALDDGSEIKVDVWGNPLISFSDVLQKAVIRLEEQAEERLYFKGRPGDIFTMKQYGWKDENSPHTVNQTLVIADREEAQNALKRLYGSE